MPTLETPDMAAFLATLLTGDATLAALLAAAGAPGNIWQIPAPPDNRWPIVLFGMQPDSGQDRPLAVGTGRLLVQANWQVKVVTRSSDDTVLMGLAERLDTIVPAATTVAPGGTVLDVLRLGPVDYPEIIGGVQYRHLGGLYRVQAHKGT